MPEIIFTSKKPVLVDLSILHFRYLAKITPLWLYPHEDPMLATESFHVSLLRCIIKHGDSWKKLKGHPYVQERRHRYNIGMVRWTDGHVREHICNRWKTYKSLKKKGWSKGLVGTKPVVLLKKPIMESRYNWDSGFLKGPEIYDGAGRVSAAIVLGWKEIPCVWAEDAHPGSMQFSKAYRKVKR